RPFSPAVFRHWPIFRALALSFLFGALLIPAALAEKKDKKSQEQKLPPPPPQPVEQELSVPRGEPLEIRLRIVGRKSETLKYLIRAGPEHGKVSEPRQISQEVSLVTYV